MSHSRKAAAAPRATLAIAGKKRLPKKENPRGDGLPPPEESARRRAGK